MNFSQRHGIEQVATPYYGFYALETMFKISKKHYLSLRKVLKNLNQILKHEKKRLKII